MDQASVYRKKLNLGPAPSSDEEQCVTLLIVDKFIEAQAKLSELAQSDQAGDRGHRHPGDQARIVAEAPSLTVVEPNDQLQAGKTMNILKSIRPSPNGISIDDFGGGDCYRGSSQS